MSNRPNLGFDDDDAPAPAVLDLSDFKPKPVARPDKKVLEKAAETANFKSREPKPAVAEQVTSPASVKVVRRRVTGRSMQLNLKARPDTIEAFYAVADANGWVLGETFEKAVDLLSEKYKK